MGSSSRTDIPLRVAAMTATPQAGVLGAVTLLDRGLGGRRSHPGGVLLQLHAHLPFYGLETAISSTRMSRFSAGRPQQPVGMLPWVGVQGILVSEGSALEAMCRAIWRARLRR
jgi:hypothetical protein